MKVGVTRRVVGFAVLLVVAIVGVVVVSTDDRTGDRAVVRTDARSDAPRSAGVSSAAVPIEPCVLGTWEVARGSLKESVDDLPYDFETDGGHTLQLNSDGTGRYDLGTAATYSATVKGEHFSYRYDGHIAFTFVTGEGRRLRLRDVGFDSEVSGKVSVAGRSVGFDAGLWDPGSSFAYTCGDDSLYLGNEVEDLDLRRKT